MARVFILVMDSFGIGASLDAPSFGDEGADTFGAIARFRMTDGCGQLHIPNLLKYGLHFAALASTGKRLDGFVYEEADVAGAYGYAVEQSFGKDTPSGHWEMAGLPVLFHWGYFPKEVPCFPKDLIDTICTQASLPGVLGNCHASGTDIIERLGAEHIQSDKPIVYTSADSVFQVAAHEEYFGLEKLLNLCQLIRPLVDKYHIGRVIARPFVGEPGSFKRTANRRDYASPPHDHTLLDDLQAAGREVIGLGKISDIFAGRGVTKVVKGEDNMAIFDAVIASTTDAPDGSLVFANFVDFDSHFGHRRDIKGYAQALEQFDQRLPELEGKLKDDDMVILTADHGCDPTFPGSDHTREHIPVLMFGPKIKPKFIGRRETFADIGQTVAQYLKIDALKHGVSFH